MLPFGDGRSLLRTCYRFLLRIGCLWSVVISFLPTFACFSRARLLRCLITAITKSKMAVHPILSYVLVVATISSFASIVMGLCSAVAIKPVEPPYQDDSRVEVDPDLL